MVARASQSTVPWGTQNEQSEAPRNQGRNQTRVQEAPLGDDFGGGSAGRIKRAQEARRQEAYAQGVSQHEFNQSETSRGSRRG
jgi:hypothetical protein